MGLEEKHRHHMQLFDTEEKDKKRRVPPPAVALTQHKDEQSMAYTVKGLDELDTQTIMFCS
jgi:hypothetical protein